MVQEEVYPSPGVRRSPMQTSGARNIPPGGPLVLLVLLLSVPPLVERFWGDKSEFRPGPAAPPQAAPRDDLPPPMQEFVFVNGVRTPSAWLPEEKVRRVAAARRDPNGPEAQEEARRRPLTAQEARENQQRRRALRAMIGAQRNVPKPGDPQ
jgi:hypothetical protein